MSKLLEGKEGETSSKRVAGFILVIGVLAVAAVGIWKDPAQASAILWPLVSFGAVCFGATAVEKMGK
jgi:uncharacterized membrane protein YiaA